MWNDTDAPLAYMITFRTYGSWLHGDERGSIDRHHNRFGGPRVSVNPVMQKQQEAKVEINSGYSRRKNARYRRNRNTKCLRISRVDPESDSRENEPRSCGRFGR